MTQKQPISGGTMDLKVLSGQGDTTPYPGVPLFTKKPVRTIGDAKKMLGKLIHAFQAGTVEGTWAKTLTYLLISFTQMVRDNEFDERLSVIEKKVESK